MYQIALSILICLIASAIGLIPYFRSLSRQFLSLFLGVGTGIMISLALLDIFPEIVHHSEDLSLLFLFGFVCIFIVDLFSCTHPHIGHNHSHGDHVHHHSHLSHDWEVKKSPILPILLVSYVGLFLHTFFDGIAIVTSFLTLWAEAGWLVTLWIVLHQIPISVGLIGVVQKKELSWQHTLVFYGVFWLSFVLGALLPALVSFTEEAILAGLAFAWGSLLYVGASDLLPDLKHHETRFATVACFLFGCILPLGLHFIHVHP